MDGVKYDQDKLKWSLLDLSLLHGVIEVLMHGEKKYSFDNWKRVINGKERYYNALLRHITSLQNGEELDKDSGQKVIDHVITNAIFLKYHLDKEKQENEELQKS